MQWPGGVAPSPRTGLSDHQRKFVGRCVSKLEERLLCGGSGGGGAAAAAAGSADGSGFWRVAKITGVSWDTCVYRLEVGWREPV